MEQRSEKGFTLLEVMIGLAILAGVIFTVLASLNYHLGVVSYNKDYVTAAMLAKEKAEDAALNDIKTAGQGVFGPPLSKFSWKLDIQDTELKELKRIEIKVFWENKNVDFVSYQQKK